MQLVKGLWFRQIHLPEHKIQLEMLARASGQPLRTDPAHHEGMVSEIEKKGHIKFLDEKHTQISVLASTVRIGRKTDCQIVLDDGVVSSIHCDLAKQPNGSWTITDLASKAGTYIKRGNATVRLKSGDFPLQNGDLLILGQTIIRVVFTG